MNLRHKKPINSYRGQANNDKNEFNDDDFKHQPSPSKKLAGSSGEQIYKYSKILTKFIMKANEYYRQRNKNHKKQKTQLESIVQQAKTTKQQNLYPKHGKKLQQPKQKRKIMPMMSKIQQEKLQFRQEKQKQTLKIEAQPKLQNKHIDLEKQKISLKPLSSKTAVSAHEPTQQKPQSKFKDQNTLPTSENFLNMYPQGIPMQGFPDQNLLTGMSVNQYMEYYKMMQIAMYQQMLKNQQFKGMVFPGMRAQMIPGMPSPAQFVNLKQNLYQNYLTRNLQQMPQVTQPQKNAPIYNLTEVYLTKAQSLFNDSKQNPNKIIKRANFHIGIAYHIYMKGLEAKGVDMKDLNLIDPTRESRQIKEREIGNRRTSRSRKKK